MKCISQQIYVVQIETRQLLEKPLSLYNGKYLHFLITSSISKYSITLYPVKVFKIQDLFEKFIQK